MQQSGSFLESLLSGRYQISRDRASTFKSWPFRVALGHDSSYDSSFKSINLQLEAIYKYIRTKTSSSHLKPFKCKGYGRIFLNRDPEHFRTILNFLRNPHSPPMPRDTAESEALVQEASFYGVHFFPFPQLAKAFKSL